MEFLIENESQIVRNIIAPDEFVPDTFDYINIGMDINIVCGSFRNDNLVQRALNPERKCVQGVTFKKPTWSMETALGWLQDNQKDISKLSRVMEKKEFGKTREIKGVEIFSTGKWNGQTFTEKDLDKMVDAFNKTKDGARPFLKLGHDQQQKLLQAEGLPAAGWVDSMYRDGIKLKADFVDIPKKVFELINNKAYRKVSIELFKGVEIMKERFDLMIGAIALLGAETPGVLNLKDILATYKIKQYDNVETYTNNCELKFNLNESQNNKPLGGNMTIEEKLAKAELEAKNAKAELEIAQADAETFKADADALKTSNDKNEKELADTKEKFNKSVADLKTIEIEKQVAELEKDGLITKAMVPFAKQILNGDVETFKIKKDEKETDATRFELIKHMFALAKGSDVNFDDNSLDTKGDGKNAIDQDKINAEIEKFSKENDCDYSTAYSEVTKKYEKELVASE